MIIIIENPFASLQVIIQLIPLNFVSWKKSNGRITQAIEGYLAPVYERLDEFRHLIPPL